MTYLRNTIHCVVAALFQMIISLHNTNCIQIAAENCFLKHGFFRTLLVILLFMFKKWYRISKDRETKARVEDKKSLAAHCNIVNGS